MNVGATGLVARSNSSSIVNRWAVPDTSVHWTGRPDRSPLHSLKCFVDAVRRFYQFVKMSNESPEKGLRCTKIRVGEQGAPSRAICVLHSDSLFACSLSFCLTLPFLCFLSSVFFTRTDAISHIGNHAPLVSKKWGQVPVFVRTNDYDGADTSVRWCGRVRTKPITGAFDRGNRCGRWFFRVRKGIIV